MSWLDRAGCRDETTDTFFGASTKRAQTICSACPVQAECLADALRSDARTCENHRRYLGFAGGLSARHRMPIVRTLQEHGVLPPTAEDEDEPPSPAWRNEVGPDGINHGTSYGYKRCIARPEGVCDVCRAYNTERLRAWRRRRSAA